MLLEESSKSLIDFWAYGKKIDFEWLNVAAPQLAALPQPLSPLRVPTSPRDWFGNLNTFNAWHQSSNTISLLSKPITVAPSTSNWVCKSFGLNSVKETGNFHFSMSTWTSFRGSQPHQTTRQAGLHALDCRLPGDGVSMSSAGFGIVSDPRCENIHSSGEYWLLDVSCESDNFTSDTYEVRNKELEGGTLHRPITKHMTGKNGATAKSLYTDRRILARKLRGNGEKKSIEADGHLTIPEFVEKDLMAFAWSIGYRNFGSHIFLSKVLDYIIESNLVCWSCKRLQGSIFLQHQIINSNWANCIYILEQIFEELISICNDKFGNHVVQRFFELSNPSLGSKILLRMKRSICDLAMDEWGNWVLQKAFLSGNNEVLRILTDVLVPNAYMLATNSFGHHVLWRAIERWSGSMVQVLLANLIGRKRKSRLIELSKDEFGCKIIQKMLENAHPPERVIIITNIMRSTHDLSALCQDRYGNYVVKYILSQFREQYSMAVMDVLDGKLSKMAKNKFCSNVLEMLYKQGGRDVEDRLIKQVDCNLLKEFLNDKFANYVVQTMLTAGEPENQEKLRRLLQKVPHLHKLKYGKFVIKLL